MGNYDAYESPIVKAVVAFKWDCFAKEIFIFQLSLSIIQFSLSLFIYFTIVTKSDGDRFDSVGRVAAFAVVTILSTALLQMEFRRFLVEGPAEYFVGQAHWKIITVSCHVTQLVVDAMLAFDVRGGRVGVAAFNIILFTFHCISYGRGHEKFGSLVNVTIQTCFEVRYFFLTTGLIILGFVCSAALIDSETNNAFPDIWQFLSLWDAGLYLGGSPADSIYIEPTKEVTGEKHPAPRTVVIFELFKFIVGLLLLNLLIAIMNSVYEDIKANVECVFLYEKSRVILDIQSLWLPIIQWWTKRPKGYYFPRWLFVLAPAAEDAKWRPTAPGSMLPSRRPTTSSQVHSSSKSSNSDDGGPRGR